MQASPCARMLRNMRASKKIGKYTNLQPTHKMEVLYEVNDQERSKWKLNYQPCSVEDCPQKCSHLNQMKVFYEFYVIRTR